MIEEYARIDHSSRKIGRRLGKNDLWIAALASVQEAAILTTDQDFDHLNPHHVKVEYATRQSCSAPSPAVRNDRRDVDALHPPDARPVR